MQDKAIEDAKYRMRRYGVSPNLLCVPPQLLLYMSLAPEEKLLYKEGGPSAVATFDAGYEGFASRAYRGMGVVTSDPFEISDDSEAVQMLQRTSQIGEFYVMVRTALSTPHALMRSCVAQLTIGACRVAGPARHSVDRNRA